jgi:signal transduction histidine kinase
MSNPSALTMLDKIFAKLFGDPANHILENRVYSAIMFLTFCAAVISTIQNFFCNIPLYVDILTVSWAAVALTFYRFSFRPALWRSLVIPCYVIYSLIAMAGWICQGGLDGSVGYYFFLLSVSIPILFTGARILIPSTMLVVCIFSIFFIELYKPDILLPYSSPLQRYSDITFALILCLFINGFMVYSVFAEYRRERAAKNRLLASIIEEKTKVENAVDSKQRLLSMVCHDIANALFTIQTSCLALRRDGAAQAENNGRRLDRLQFAVNNVNEIIQSVRLLQAIDEGKAALALERVDLTAMIDTAQKLFSERFKEKNIRLDIAAPQGPPCMVMVEPKIFCNHVLSNLLSNAVKFSYPGSAISINVERRGEEISVSVIDHGVGIPRHLLDTLFQRNTNALRSGTKGESGTGLGLFVVKNFVELFKGRIEISSQSEAEFPDAHGCTVTLFLKTPSSVRENGSYSPSILSAMSVQ